MTETTFAQQVLGEKKKIDEETKKYREAQGLKEYWVPQEGETRVEILPVAIRDDEYEGAPKKVFCVKVDGKEFDWSLNPKNPVYRQLINGLANAQNKFCLLRTGDGKATKYKLLEK